MTAVNERRLWNAMSNGRSWPGAVIPDVRRKQSADHVGEELPLRRQPSQTGTDHKQALGSRTYARAGSAEGDEARLSRVGTRLLRVHLRYHSSELGGA